MKSLLVHGVYDIRTLDTLNEFGVSTFALDLRARSVNLVPYSELKLLFKKISSKHVFLIFENDRAETILSYLGLVKNESQNFVLLFRDSLPWQFYQSLNFPFYWMFDPQGDWQSILTLPLARGILLPIALKDKYQYMPELWDLIEKKQLELYLHASSFEEALNLESTTDINISIELSHEVESTYRCVDQEKLKSMKIWRKLNEGPSL